MSSPNGAPVDEPHRNEAEEPQTPATTYTRQTRPSRDAAGKANANISAVALRETSPEVQENSNLLAETLTAFSGSKRDDSLAWAEIESEPVGKAIFWSRHQPPRS